MTTAIYLRVSTEKQDESLQLHAIKRILPYDEFNSVKIYKDFGLTGTNTNRPDYQRLLTDITEGKVEKLICYEFSRLWRDLEEQNRMFKRLKVLNIKLQSATEGFIETEDDKLKANILGAVNVHEVERIRRRIKDALDKKKKECEAGLDTWRRRGPDKKKRKSRKHE